MTVPIRRTVLTGVVAALATACGSSSTAATSSTVSPSASSSQGTHTPAAVPPIPNGPFAVLVTNSNRQGTTYDVVLVDLAGHVAARATARLPLLKAHQSINPVLVSASNSRAYFLDGDTDIRSLLPSGATALVKSIPAGQNATLAFSVRPDDQRIAVAVISQGPDDSKTTGRGYVESLADTSNHVDLFSNTGSDALRWPVAWHDSGIVDVISGAYCGQGYGGSCATGYHVIDSANGHRLATVCESRPSQQSDSYDNYVLWGLPARSGSACSEFQGGPGAGTSPRSSVLGIDWTGREHQFLTSGSTADLPVRNCFIAPDGARMACDDSTSQALTLLSSDGNAHGLGRRYQTLGWIDSGHLLVGVNSTTLGVLSVDSAVVAPLAMQQADTVSMAAALPGGL